MFLKLTRAGTDMDVYVNFDKANCFYYIDREGSAINLKGTKIVFNSNEHYEEDWQLVKETPEQIMEMLNGGKPATIRTTMVQRGEGNIQIGHVNELTV